ncbi:MAG TPA: hypothetical protein VK154_16495 [Chitinophagales bacterium]|nr:hypothetical protein [Chitinophagales bacterium]
MKLIFDIFSIAFAVAAAVLWFRSARVKAPESSGIFTITGNSILYSFDPSIKNLGNTTVNEKEFFPAMSGLLYSYKKQSDLSAKAAIAAGLAALFQSISFIISLIS